MFLKAIYRVVFKTQRVSIVWSLTTMTREVLHVAKGIYIILFSMHMHYTPCNCYIYNVILYTMSLALEGYGINTRTPPPNH